MINNAEYAISSAKVGQCPPGDKPEYAFIGRSNVGKSSLINMLTGVRGLAKTSSMPGKTMLINHFSINQGQWFLVDLPGYGFAKRSKREQEKLTAMIRDYVLGREQLTCLFLLIDSRLTPQHIDLEFTRFLGENGVPFAIVFTKADKLSHSKTMTNVRLFLSTLEQEWEELPPHFVTSSETRMGRDTLLQFIEGINQQMAVR